MSHIDYTFKVMVLGEPGVGKTTFLERTLNILSEIETPRSYIGYLIPRNLQSFKQREKFTMNPHFHVKTLELQGKRIKLQLWGLENDEQFRFSTISFLLPTYSLGAKGAIIIYDITRSSTLDNISEWITIIKAKSGPIPIVLVGNKADLHELQQVNREDGKEFATSNDLQGYTECNAKIGENVKQVFVDLTELMLEEVSKMRTS